MQETLQAILAGLPPGAAEAIQGAIVTSLVSALRGVAADSWWQKKGPYARLMVVAVVAAVWAGGFGWAAGLKGPQMVTHIVGALVSALGLRQVVKAQVKARAAQGSIPHR